MAPGSGEHGSAKPRPASALPSVQARALAFAAIVTAGVCGGLIGFSAVKVGCHGNCSTPEGIGGLTGALIAATGVSVIAVLVLRAMGEWRSIKEKRQLEMVVAAASSFTPRPAAAAQTPEPPPTPTPASSPAGLETQPAEPEGPAGLEPGPAGPAGPAGPEPAGPEPAEPADPAEPAGPAGPGPAEAEPGQQGAVKAEEGQGVDRPDDPPGDPPAP